MQALNGTKIDKTFVERWSTRYDVGSREAELFSKVGPTAVSRGHFVKFELLQVGSWKSRRSSSLLAANSEEDVEEITRLAFSGPERLRHRVLQFLTGVRVPMASALLTVWDPTRFTVMDVRAIRVLHYYGEIATLDPPYFDYLELCRSIAKRVAADLRTLDRALWKYDKEVNGSLGTTPRRGVVSSREDASRAGLRLERTLD